jgi:serpin B
MRNLGGLALALILITTVAAAQQPTADYRDAVDANSRFALKVVRSWSARLDGNRVVSPIALSSGFALLRNGANPQCANEIASAFELERLPEEVANRAYGALLTDLLNHPLVAPVTRSSEYGAGQSRRKTTEAAPPSGLFLTNSFWDLRAGNFSVAFRTVNEKFYGAEINHVRYDKNAVSAINTWAKTKSYGLMPRVVNTVAEDDFLFTSLLYLRSRWRDEFMARNTHEGDFTLLTGEKKKVQMMRRSGHYLYAHTPTFEAIMLPYIDGRMLYIFLPDTKSSLREFQLALTEENWNKWVESMSSLPGTIELPRFRVRVQSDVRTMLEDLGAGCAFASFAAFDRAVPIDGVNAHACRAVTIVRH